MFVVCGETLFDVFPAGETPTGLMLDARMGGSPFNVAIGLARLGQPVALLTSVSDGFLGRRLVAALADAGVDTGCIQLITAPATLSLVGADATGRPHYDFVGAGAADRLLKPAALDRLPRQRRAVHVGSYACIVGQTAQTLRQLVAQEHAHGFISYDPNVRPTAEPEMGLWRDHLAWMLPRTHLLKMSDEDAALLYPGRPLADVAGVALAAGVAAVVITRGARSACAWTAHHAVEVPAAAVSVVDTVGAGDSFQAALLAWLADHDSLSPAGLAALGGRALTDALTFASAAAALTCSRRGADPPRRAELP